MRSSRPSGRGTAQGGYTLVELIVAMGISAILGMIVFAVVVFSIGFARRGAAEVEGAQFARIALSQMVRDLREARGGADAVAIWPEAGEGTFRAIGFVSARQEAGGRVFQTDGSGTPVWQTAIYYVYDPASRELRRIARPWEGTLALPSDDRGRVVARGVKAVRISRQDDLVTIALVATAGRRETRLETAVSLRN